MTFEDAWHDVMNAMYTEDLWSLKVKGIIQAYGDDRYLQGIRDGKKQIDPEKLKVILERLDRE